MEADEAGTLERLKINRSRIFDPSVAAHGGRMVKLMGDGALVEFTSVTYAVNCALAIQDATAHAEPERAEAKRICYRIGINLGDVIVDGEDSYGEGVNVAARLQALAPQRTIGDRLPRSRARFARTPSSSALPSKKASVKDIPRRGY